MYFALGVVMLGVTIFALVYALNPETSGPGPNLGALATIAAFLFFRGARNLKKRTFILSLDHLGGDTRVPVLFLRSFAEDGKIDSGAKVLRGMLPWKWGKLLQPRPLMLSLWSLMRFRWTFEQVLAHATRKIGPLVAVGPLKAPPVLGAYNFYMGDDWKEQVHELAARAQLVVLRVGSTQGLLWEVGNLTTFLTPQKLLLFVPDGEKRWWWPFWRKGNRKKLYAQFRERTANQFPVALPETLAGAASIGFDADWRPILFKSRKQPADATSIEYVAYTVNAIT